MNADTTIYHPDYYRIIERRDGKWFLKLGELFYTKLPFAVDMNDFELLYSITKQQVAIELFRINGGKAGYYLADLRQKKYYYCGTELDAVKTKLRSLYQRWLTTHLNESFNFIDNELNVKTWFFRYTDNCKIIMIVIYYKWSST